MVHAIQRGALENVYLQVCILLTQTSCKYAAVPQNVDTATHEYRRIRASLTNFTLRKTTSKQAASMFSCYTYGYYK